MLLSDQIAAFFDYQYLWKESINNFVTLHGLSHQGKVAPETATCLKFVVSSAS